MVSIIKDNLQELKSICKRHHVEKMFLFGSATDAVDFSSKTDIDLLYKFSKSEIPEMDYADNFFSLLFTLQSLLKRNIDLVPEEKLNNPFFIDSIDKQKILIYES